MALVEFEPWEPEETVGKIWHGLASRIDAPQRYPEASVELGEVSGRLAVFFRALGGAPSVEIRPTEDESSHHRLSFKRRLGTEVEALPRTSFDGEALRLPARLALFPAREANAALYLWLTAASAHAGRYVEAENPLERDLRALSEAHKMCGAVVEDCPGLAGLHRDLSAASVAARKIANLPKYEAAVEAALCGLLIGETPERALAKSFYEAALSGNIPADLPVPRGYKPFQPVPIWPELRDVTFSAPSDLETRDTEGTPEENTSGKTHRARRRKSDQAERKDSLILHKFEGILSWAEFLNLNRRVDDDDNDDAKKAADDQEEIGLGQISKAPATKLKLHLDLAPEDVDREAISGQFTYPEWDARTGAYMQDHTCVFDAPAEPSDAQAAFQTDPRAKRRIQAVRRQFEALRPGRVILPAQPDGEDLDLEAAVRSYVDISACGHGSNRIWRQSRPEARDLAVSILLDTSRSTESVVAGRPVIEIEREAMAALSWGLNACGDTFAINSFSSLKRNRVYVNRCKAFDEDMSLNVEAKIAALRPGFYTRLGAAIRHVSVDLQKQSQQRKLLLILTDGKPNDLDHYEGRHGIEDTRMAIREARRGGAAVYGITIDAKSKAWFSRMFGSGRFSVIPNPDHLTAALPQIYRQLTCA
ncbi:MULTISPECIES: nitric oxide reductase activation protein NorD [Halocynthiibacter]|uniref:VWA domain-containing protein n=1 Tax=Halocynthiibacter halioticoli TaxID=2986804 RepID=A0AAE3IYP5_9RHOB|nr:MULTISPECIES: VWA domain-containing protein [Halocynthiibacter]MCV6823371.1 VWA domain-containing protein [Halocynthiibacter halioticoli]MCW4056372.1 VWA domain-containing protein [Halocynthiibacter sp. SDUM655004]